MQESVKMIFKLKSVPKPDDAADALAIALCHFFSLKFKDCLETVFFYCETTCFPGTYPMRSIVEGWGSYWF